MEKMETIKILMQDPAFLALDKPVGVVVNRSDTFDGTTVQDFVESLNILESTEMESDFINRSGIVHRIDKDTSGVLLVAKTVEAFDNLLKQFKSRQVKKEYLVITVGKVPESKFIVEAAIGRNPKNRLMMAIVNEGRPARTEFELVDTFELDGVEYSKLLAYPLTGRTHQIRIHLASLNFPVAGDPIYCTKRQFQTTSEAFGRMMLHAKSIEFTHPVTGSTVKIESDIPQDFTKNI